MNHIYSFITLVLLNYIPVTAQEKEPVKSPAYYGGLHFAGNTGLLSVSFGKKFFNEHLVLGAGYGYLPQAVNGTEVHSIILKTSYIFSKGFLYRDASWYTGFSTIYGITRNTYLKYPSYYPKDYYATNALHVAPYIGLRVPFFFYKPTWANKVYFHTELGTVDTYLYYLIINKNVRFWDACNISIGIYYDI